MKRDGDVLLAKFGDVNPDFENGVRTKAYHSRSVSVEKAQDGTWRVRHVGWLGAVPPAVKGLKPVRFNDSGNEVFTFAAADWQADRVTAGAFGQVASILRNVRDFFIEKFGLEAADNAMSTWQIESINESANQLRTVHEGEGGQVQPYGFNSPDPHNPEPKGNQVTQDEAKQLADAAAAAAVEAQQAEFAAQLKAKDEELNQLKFASRKADIETQVDGWIKEGKLLPANRLGTIEFMTTLKDDAVLNFSAADGTDVKKGASVWFAEFMGSQKAIEMGALPAGTDPAPVKAEAIASKTMQYMAEQKALGVFVSATEATAHVTGKAQ